MAIEFTVGKYSVFFTNHMLRYACVMLYDANRHWRARLDFAPQPNTNDVTPVLVSGDFIQVYMNVEHLDTVLEMLRTEKPVSVLANTEYNIFIVGTDEEPVGEQELTALIASIRTLLEGP